ncbi:MAG: hypothetical protein R6X25_10525 [Candidatus Krumholzibacteriia bacterium]
MFQPDPSTLSIGEVIRRICNLNDGICDFWRRAYGWAPGEAASLLAESRLDRQAALSRCLALWMPEAHPEARRDGALILGWANLGALVEGTLKWFLSVYREEVPDDAIKKFRKTIGPEAATLEQLRLFYLNHYVWFKDERDEWDPWLTEIRDRRNAVHAYKDSSIGTFEDLHNAIKKYLELIRTLEGRMPYPDEHPGPQENG